MPKAGEIMSQDQSPFKQFEGFEQKSNLSKKTKTIEEGSNVYFLVPPMGNIQGIDALGAAFHSVIWVQSTTKKYPIKSVLWANKDGSIRRPDALHQAVNKKKEQLTSMVTQLDAAGKKDQADMVREEIKGLPSEDRAYFLNVMDQTGNVSLLKVRSSAYKDLKQKIDELRIKGVLQNKGFIDVAFDFKRFKDETNRTHYRVEPATQTVRDPVSNKLTNNFITMDITPEILKSWENGYTDPTTQFHEYTEEEKQVMASLDPVSIDRVLQRGRKVDQTQSSQMDSSPSIDMSEQIDPTPARQVLAQTTNHTVTHNSPPVVAPAGISDEVARFLASRKAKK